MHLMVPRSDQSHRNRQRDQEKILSSEVSNYCNLDFSNVQFSWRAITMLAEKAQLFRDDCFFREALHDLSCLPKEKQLQFLSSYTLLLFKPDAVVARKIWPTIRIASSLGFIPVWFTSVQITRCGMRDLWRYSWNGAAIERIQLSTELNQATSTLCIVLRRQVHEALPASVSLSLRKGSADPRYRTAANIRTRLGAPNRVLSFIHCADEPADLLRELGVLLDVSERRALFRAIESESVLPSGMLAASIAALEAKYSSHDLDIDRCSAVVSADSGETGNLFRLGARQFEVPPTPAKERSQIFSSLLELLRQKADPLSKWDLICALSDILPPDPPDAQSQIPNDCSTAWSLPESLDIAGADD